ncbi:MAG: leucine-rich repeat protein [Clostridia bacterium]|nr:leucine-rich repeat protein [Clostridia bacterium]
MKTTWKRMMSLALAMLMCLGIVLPEMAKVPWRLLLPEAAAEEAESRGVPSWAYELPQEPLGREQISGEWRYALRTGDGYAVITGYDGQSATPSVPARLDGHDVVGMADGVFSRAVEEVTLHGNILRMEGDPFCGAQPVIRALNGTYALWWAEQHGLPWLNTSTGVFVPDVVDFSDAPSGRVRRRGDTYVQLGQLEALRVQVGSLIWLTDARGIVFFYRITALTPQGSTVLATVEVPEVGDVVRELSLTQTIDLADCDIIPAEGVVEIDTPAGSKDRSTSAQPMESKTLNLSGVIADTAGGFVGSLNDEIEINCIISIAGTIRYTVEVHDGILTFYETTENEVSTVTFSLTGKTNNAKTLLSEVRESKVKPFRVPVAEVAYDVGFFKASFQLNFVMELEGEISYQYTAVKSTTERFDFDAEEWVTVDKYATVKVGDGCHFRVTARAYVEMEISIHVLWIVELLEVIVDIGIEIEMSYRTQQTYPCVLFELRGFARASFAGGVWIGENDDGKIFGGAKHTFWKGDLLPRDWLVLRFHVYTEDPVFHMADDCPFNTVCTVKFEPRNGQTIPNIEVYSGLPIGNDRVPEIIENEYTGKFLGWCTEPTGEGVNWEIGSIDGDIVTKNMTLYGIWEKTVPVEFISYADVTPDVQHVPVGGKAVEPATPTREGHTFLYWYVEQEDGKAKRWYFRDYVVPEEGLTLLAKWRNDETGEEVDGDGTTSVMTIGGGASVSAWQDTEEYFKYSITWLDGKAAGVQITGLTSKATHVRIPAFLTVDVDSGVDVDWETLPVMSISSSMFRGNTNLVAVDFAWQGQIDSQSSMFSGCTNLQYVDMRGIAMTSVASSMFSGCSSLEEVILPPGIKTIGSSAFSGCASLDGDLKLLKGVSEVGSSAFSGCKGLACVSLPDSVKTIGSYAFENCSGMETLDLGEGVTTIGSCAFKNCSSLEEIYLPDSYSTTDYSDSYVSYGPFVGCKSVRRLSIGCSNVTIYDYDVNIDSECLEEVVIRGSVKTISGSCFRYSGEMRSGSVRVVLEEGVEVIQDRAFEDCAGITEIVLPTTLKTIGASAFEGCSGITKINFADTTQIVTIGSSAFSGCKGITSIALPDTLKTIGGYAFENCSSVRTLDLGEGVTTIGSCAFKNCSSLEAIYLPDSYRTTDYSDASVSYGPFVGCKSVRKLSIGCSNGVIYDYDVNIDSVCLEEVVIRGSVKTISAECFYYASEMRSGNVRVVLEEGVVTIKEDAFYGCKGITEVILPSTLKTIESSAFSGCTNLHTLRINATTTVASNAFPKNAGMQVHVVGLSSVPEETAQKLTDYFASLGANVVDAVQSYTLEMSANGGAFEDEVVEIRIKYGWLSVIEAMPQPVNGERIFSGWFTDAECTQRFTSQTMPARDVTLYAGWDVDVHTVTLNLMGGSLDHALTFRAAAGTNPVAGLLPEMAERTFTGWYLDRYATTPFDGEMPSADVTLYAGYTMTGVNGEYVIANGAATLVAYHLVEHESTTVYLPETVEGVPLTHIADGAFDGTDVRVLYLPAGLTSVSPAAFTGMARLSAIHVREGNTTFREVNGVLYSADGTVLVCYPAMHGTVGVVPSGVKEIAPYAFAGVPLTSITLPEGLEKIGERAFMGTQITTLTLPESLRVLGDRAFSGCGSLCLVILGSGLETLGTGVFENTSGLLAAFGPVMNAEGTAPSAVAVWAGENHLLYNYYELKLVAASTYTLHVQAGQPMELPTAADVGENLYFTGWYAQADGSGDAVAVDALMPKAATTLYAGSRAVFTYETVTDENGVSTLTLTGWDANCGEAAVTIPESIGGVPVTAVAGGCFTAEAESIAVPASVTALADGWLPEGWQGQIIAPAGSAAALYAEASGLTCTAQTWQLTLETNGGASLAAITAAAGEMIALPTPVRSGCEFAGWYTDESLTETATLTEEGLYAMPDVSAALYAAWTVTDEAAAQLTFTYTETDEGVIVTGLADGATTLDVPATLHGLPVIGMAERAFALETELVSVKLPGSIGLVPDSAFMGCSALTSVELGEGITELGTECFMRCVSLTGLTLPESLEQIGSCALEETGLTTLHLPANVTWIASDALNGCSSLASVTAVEENEFYMSVDGVLYDLLDDKLVKYPAARPGTSYTVRDGVCVIGSYAFSGCALESITLPESVWSLESYAFSGCRSLKALPDMPSAYLNSIPANAFAGCYTLKEIVIPENITAIGDYAFTMCPALVTAQVPGSVTKIGRQAFGASVTIYGVTGSAAENWATENRLLFVDPDNTVLPESIVISAETLDMARGETQQLTAAIQPENATVTDILWSSSDPAVVTVSSTGEVRALSAGTAQVYARTLSGLAAVCAVTVSSDILVYSLILDADAVTLTETQQYQMAWSMLPANATQTALTWTTTDGNVCLADENGLITAMNAGSATITATAPGGVSASCEVTVLRRVQEVTLTADTLATFPGTPLTLTVGVLPADAADPTLVWTIEPAEDAVYADGVLTLNRSGFYTVTAMAADLGVVSASLHLECRADVVWYLPAELREIETEAFLGLTAEHIVLDSSVETIGARAFANCASLYRIDIPASVTFIDATAFDGTRVTIVCQPGSYAQQWAEDNGFPWISDGE